MKIGIISDAHANVVGLKACISFLEKEYTVDKIYFLGDAVGYFLNPNETIDLLREKQVTCIAGNHDAMITGKIVPDPQKAKVYLVDQTKHLITDSNLDFLNGLQPSVEFEVKGKKILMVHGTPFDNYAGYFYPTDNVNIFDSFQVDVICMGHTHWPLIKQTPKGKLIINPGSCGLPRDLGDRASLAIYDMETNLAQIYRVRIDVEDIIRVNSYLDSSVIDCLRRKSDNAFGEMVN